MLRYVVLQCVQLFARNIALACTHQSLTIPIKLTARNTWKVAFEEKSFVLLKVVSHNS